MKVKLLGLLVFTLFLTSCSIDDATRSFFVEVLPIQSVEMPDEFVFGETHEIFMDYTKPSDCYEFNNFLYQIDGQERTVGIINTVYTDVNCNPEPETVTVSFDFTVTSMETYVFKFYQGEGPDGTDQYLIVEVPVADE